MRIFLLCLAFLPTIGLVQVNALINAIPDCGNSCNGGVIVDFEDLNNNPPYSVSVYFDNADPYVDILLGTQTTTSNDTSLNFMGFCSFSVLNILIVDANDDTSFFVASAPYFGMTGWLHDCICVYGFAGAGAIGGFPPYTFTLNVPGQPQQTSTGLEYVEFDSLICTGATPTITISDMNGCIAFYTPLIDAPCNAPNPTCVKEVNLTFENVSDSSNCDGTIIWEIEGVDITTQHQLIITSWAGYNDTLILAPGVLTDTLTNLCPSYYTFKLDKDSSCFDFTSGHVKYPQPIVHTSFLETDSIQGCGTCTNSLNWTFNDYYNNGPYQIYLLNDQGIYVDSMTTNWNNCSGAFQSLCAETYTVMVLNTHGDSLTSTAVVTDATNSFSIDSTSIVQTYTGQSSGSIEIFSSGGHPSYQYSIDDGITWQLDSLFSGLSSGNYTILAMDSTGCIVSTIVTITNGDVGLSESEIHLEIFPNPSDGIFTIRSQGIHLFVITDMQGQIIRSGEFNDTQTIDLSNESKGVYLISVQSTEKTGMALLIIH
jgi:hypothetical protein